MKLSIWIKKQSTFSLLGKILGIIVFWFSLMVFGAFMEGRTKYIYWGILLELISLTSCAIGVLFFIRNEIPMGAYSIKGNIAKISGAIALLISLIGIYSFLPRLLYWINK